MPVKTVTKDKTGKFRMKLAGFLISAAVIGSPYRELSVFIVLLELCDLHKFVC